MKYIISGRAFDSFFDAQHWAFNNQLRITNTENIRFRGRSAKLLTCTSTIPTDANAGFGNIDNLTTKR
mgnify:CR=1 FL=1